MEIFELAPLFEEVQRRGIFADGKTFVDSTPRRDPTEILIAYLSQKQNMNTSFDLRRFVEENFVLPHTDAVAVPGGEGLETHIRTLWRLLRREPDAPEIGNSLIPLPYPYIVPGGRFREIYYWDSYFTMLGLRECGDEAMIKNMADNFAYLIGRFGHIPNGNRTYYLSRSQPPVFAMIVELLAECRGGAMYQEYHDVLRREYAYWMDQGAPTRHVVAMPDGSVLNRYYDQLDVPRYESFAEDEAVFRRSGQKREMLMRNLRSAAESGWDFSSRWFADGKTMETVETTDLIPVDLNCLLYQLEKTLARAYEADGDLARQRELEMAARHRAEAISKYCWHPRESFFCDYAISAGRPSPRITLAGVFPLFFQLASPEQARVMMHRMRGDFLQRGGVVTSLNTSGQQWDAPNGWAPLQWITIRGLEHYGYVWLAEEIARRWIKLNSDVYDRTGKLMEKYNVVDTSLEAGGGEYPSQDGFGWTIGVLLKLMHRYR